MVKSKKKKEKKRLQEYKRGLRCIEIEFDIKTVEDDEIDFSPFILTSVWRYFEWLPIFNLIEICEYLIKLL